MISLFINTSSSFFHGFVMKDGKIVASSYEKLDHNLSDEALVIIKRMLDNNGILPSDVDKIYAVNGPGSFTGLRIGVTIAKVFAWGLNKKLYPVSSLYTMATSIDDCDYIIPIIDARRGYVFAGIYDKNYENVMEDQYISLEELNKKRDLLNGTSCFVSFNNFDFEVRNFVPNNYAIIDNYKGKEVSAHSFVPEYLKKTEAEEHLHD